MERRRRHASRGGTLDAAVERRAGWEWWRPGGAQYGLGVVAARWRGGSLGGARVKRKRSCCGAGTQLEPGAAAAFNILRVDRLQCGTESESSPAGLSDRVLSLNRRLLALRRATESAMAPR